ncbi:uncharacterized protein AB675_5682 [Cyphellophora attinorum]|uniref:MYND-type domain-containing protein n=1 Tax=Cyphellophora attinorum TaxID=1664694 RepID=A0A0N1HWE6_9EURO|nr:uncharacterized protein AB675_5682 [Phialophora attinorum]KPI41932.1 hypothetical protein AB675_5682 [Phialophora attinorum]
MAPELVSPWSCWGGGILESDRALDAVSGDLSQDLGVNLNFIGDSEHFAGNPECTHDPKARSVEDTRLYLNQGNFDRVFRKYQMKTGRNVFPDGENGVRQVVTGPEACSFLVAKAVMVGARIRNKQLEWLKANYKKAGLCKEGIEQMEKALADYPNDGTPYHLIEPDRTDHDIYHAFEEARAKIMGGNTRLDYPAPRYFEIDVPTQDPLKASKVKERRAKGEPTWFPGGPVLRECGKCGVLHHHVEKLSACSACKKILYCGKDCQRAHWKVHKKHCASFAAAPPPPTMAEIERFRSPMLKAGHDPLAKPGTVLFPLVAESL